ncbi:hypothetical protein [Streptomyces sp. H27-C3]|uniref:hypothetical protein n=1 Tax=Streptomyces sp. H27-C3 TaxID=3046305 RepID=UPI0024B9B5EE|nr:hypothetical protein [Streptomyces sp. H27-C3]MDJ0462222.1 hypothetical protein [Streptomyces sp. H27-C3]
MDLSAEEMLPFFADCAQRAEAVRVGGAEVVFVAGCEISSFGNGFIPGATYGDRLGAMAGADMDWWRSLGPVLERLNGFLREAAAVVREHFGGRITYVAGPWEFIDWGPFDLVGVDAYRAAYNTETFRAEIREHFKHGKPVAVIEYGTCAYRGAAERGGMAWQVPEGVVADEGEQVRYFNDLLDVFEEEGVDTALWFTFAGFGKVGELDASSYGVVRMLDEMPEATPSGARGETRWEPKEAFHAVAARYGQG